MKTIRELLLDASVISPQTLYVPIDAEIVDVHMTPAGLKLIIITNPIENNSQLKTFKICATDENIYHDTVKYIGSFEATTGKRFVIELIRGE